MSVIIKLLSKFDDSGIKKAQKGFGGLKATVGAIGIGFGLKAITSELAQATKNAQADVISQKQLARQLKITAKLTDEQIAKQEDYITKLSMTTGVVDDELRPSFGVLLRATGSVTKAQELMSLSLDTSAGTGKNLEIVTKSIARAYGGNITGLQKLVPGIKKGTDAMGFLKEQFAGARETLANPFDKLQIAVDETKEKIGMVLLPYVQEFATYIIEEVVPNVEKFLDDVSNPKTEAGKTFIQIKDAITETIGAVKTFFGYFGDGDAVKGFGEVAAGLIKALPALLALKGIMMLANSGKAIANLITAMTAIAAGNTGSPISKFTKTPVVTAAKYLVPVAITAGALDTIDAEFTKPENRKFLANQSKSKFSAYNPGMDKGLFVGKDGKGSSGNIINNITINNTAVDPKKAVDALGKYVKTNGRLPATLFWNARG
jgi:hypothetical protein